MLTNREFIERYKRTAVEDIAVKINCLRVARIELRDDDAVADRICELWEQAEHMDISDEVERFIQVLEAVWDAR